MTESARQDEDAGGTRFAAAATTDAIETAFDGRWGIWLSYTGRWWAARHDGPGPGGRCTPGVVLVRADDPDELKARIQEQEALPRGDGVGWQPSRMTYSASGTLPGRAPGQAHS